MFSLRPLFATILVASLPTTFGAAIPESTDLRPRSVWQPTVGDTWQIVLDSPIKLSIGASRTTPDVSIFDIDLFGNDASTITALHSLGKKVVCYFSAGTKDPWAPDSSQFQDSDIGPAMADWPDENWVDTRNANVRSIMAARIVVAQQKGCDGIDPDNVDAYVSFPTEPRLRITR